MKATQVRMKGAYLFFASDLPGYVYISLLDTYMIKKLKGSLAIPIQQACMPPMLTV